MWKIEEDYWQWFYKCVEQFRKDFEGRPEDWDLFYASKVEQLEKKLNAILGRNKK